MSTPTRLFPSDILFVLTRGLRERLPSRFERRARLGRGVWGVSPHLDESHVGDRGIARNARPTFRFTRATAALIEARLRDHAPRPPLSSRPHRVLLPRGALHRPGTSIR